MRRKRSSGQAHAPFTGGHAIQRCKPPVGSKSETSGNQNICHFKINRGMAKCITLLQTENELFEPES